MKYRLKDKALQKKLDEISDGDFSREIEQNKKRIASDIMYMKQATLWFGPTEGPLHGLVITPDMIEEVREAA